MENSLMIDNAIIIVLLVAELLFHIVIIMNMAKLLKKVKDENK